MSTIGNRAYAYTYRTVESSMPARRFLAAMVVILIAGFVLNTVWETSEPDSTARLRMATGPDLIDLARAEKPSLPIKVGFALSLRRVAAGGILIVPDIDIVESRQIDLLSVMTIQVEDYDARLDKDDLDALESIESIEGVGKIHFTDQNPSDFVIGWIPGTEPVKAMRVFLVSTDTIVVLDERIVIEMDS